mmetsp:Transcript_30233/g.90590  ORF Transcript_30233/g.90590 Transcript_30233/m.90590 type:complete len:282 (-) Transcript_30233:310-1155(-)
MPPMPLVCSKTSDRDCRLLKLEPEITSSLEQELEVLFISNSDNKRSKNYRTSSMKWAVGATSTVVLCTQTETFKVTAVESSNSTLLATGSLVGSGVIRSIVSFHWEARRIDPRLDFRSSLPTYSVNDPSTHEAAPDLKQLQASMQASITEIKVALQSSTVLINEFGSHFYLHEASLHQCLDELLMTLSLRGWSPSAIPLQACAEDAAKHGSDCMVATYCLKHFSLSQSSSGEINLDVRRVARALTKSLFTTKSTYSSTLELIRDLRDCLPVRNRGAPDVFT